jgi:uncharacterized protein (TIGR03435 family)
MRLLAVSAGVFLTVWVAFSQVAPPPTEFETAEVTRNISGDKSSRSEISRDGEVHFRNVTIGELLPIVFQRKENLILGVPAWMRSERYDITAKAQPDFSEVTLGKMLQSLLNERFRMSVHDEQKPMDAFALIPAPGGHKLHKASPPAFPSCAREGSAEEIKVDCTSILLRDFVSFLDNAAKDYLDRPIVDQTGLAGTWKFKLSWTPKRFLESKGGMTVFEAMNQQIGLRLEQKKLPLSVVVIDHIESLAGN